MDLTDPEPLCPSHLMCGRRIVTLPYPQVSKKEIVDPDNTTGPMVYPSGNNTFKGAGNKNTSLT